MLNSNSPISDALNEVSLYYDEKCAKRSGIPLMNHINEGIAILQAIGASNDSQSAFALHPIAQNEDIDNWDLCKNHSKNVIDLAKEYSVIANSYLCRPETDHIKTVTDLSNNISKSISYEVLQMLYADKIQNRKDFILYHLGDHKRSDELLNYFNIWITYLDRKIKIWN